MYESMNAMVYRETGEASVIQMERLPLPMPSRGEVRVRIVVSAVNPTDWKSRRGVSMTAGRGLVQVPNHDGSGVIDAVGHDTPGFAVGDRVWLAISAYNRPFGGTAQEFTVLPTHRVFHLPDAADFDLGACLGVPAITAHRALTVAQDGPARLAPGALKGALILVAGGAGAVGHATIQLARWAGATVITTVSSPEKAELAKSAGAQYIFNYATQDIVSEIRKVAPAGVDVIVEVSPSVNAGLDLDVVKPRGTIVIYASNGEPEFTVSIGRNMTLNVRYQFILLYLIGQDKFDAAAEDLRDAIEDGALLVGEGAGLPLHRFTLETTADAHAAVEAQAVGKVLIDVSAP